MVNIIKSFSKYHSENTKFSFRLIKKLTVMIFWNKILIRFFRGASLYIIASFFKLETFKYKVLYFLKSLNSFFILSSKSWKLNPENGIMLLKNTFESEE